MIGNLTHEVSNRLKITSNEGRRQETPTDKAGECLADEGCFFVHIEKEKIIHPHTY